MADHEFDQIPNVTAAESTKRALASAPRQHIVDPRLLAIRVRAAYEQATKPVAPFGEATSELSYDLSVLADSLESQSSQVIPELTKPVQAYKNSERLTILLAHQDAKFIPAGQDEIRYAFGLLHGLEHGEDARQKLDRIAGHAYKIAGEDTPKPEKTAKRDKTIVRVSQNYAAFAQHALSSKGKLHNLRKEVEFSLSQGETYGSLAEYSAVAGGPAFDGFGQLARFVDTVMVTMDQPDGDTGNAFSAKLAKNGQDKSVVSDPFIAKQLTPEIAQREQELLGLITMDNASMWIGLAMRNEMSRELFWKRRVEEARRVEVVKPTAGAALKGMTA